MSPANRPTRAQERVLRAAANVLRDLAKAARAEYDAGVTYTGQIEVREDGRYEFAVRTERSYLHVLYRRDLLDSEPDTDTSTDINT